MRYGYNIPVFFEDCSNPITLKYVNNNVVENYAIDSTKTLKYDGSLLKSANVFINDIETTITFDLNIITTNDEVHEITVELEVPLQDNNSSIYDGFFEKKNEKLNMRF